VYGNYKQNGFIVFKLKSVICHSSDC